MGHVTSTSSGRAFTLIEMLVVIALILIMMTIAAAMFPRFAENQRITKGADQIVTALLNAKALAIRNRVATGVRFESDGTTASRMIFIRQVDDYYVTGTKCVDSGPIPGMPNRFEAKFTGGPFRFDQTYFVLPAQGGQAHLAPVLYGDYFESNHGGLVSMIDGVVNDGQGNLLRTTSRVSAHHSPYRIIRQPRPVEGEAPLDLPQNIVVDFGGPGRPRSKDVPVREVLLGDPRLPRQQRIDPRYSYSYEILFAPGGSVVGKGTATGDNIILWVRDVTKDDSATPIEGSPLLVSIHTRTGFVAVHPVNINPGPGQDFYSFTRDGRSSGL